MSLATFAAAQLLRVLPRTRITRAVGKLCDAELPPGVSEALVRLYVRAYGVDLDEADGSDRPFPSFDAFFTRGLRAGVRPIDAHPDVLVSPSDGRLVAAGAVEVDGEIRVKGRPYRVADLVGDDAEAQRYQGGEFAVVYLHPRDYHRVHAPIDGEIRLVRSMSGDYFPVNSIGERHVPSLFAKNRRVAIGLDSARRGRVTVVMVGAMIVGRITVTAVPGRDVPPGTHVVDPPLEVLRGEEIGVFHLGSTAVLLVEPGAWPPIDRPPGPVRLGEPLGGA